jgi:hypothetical protein
MVKEGGRGESANIYNLRKNRTRIISSSITSLDILKPNQFAPTVD